MPKEKIIVPPETRTRIVDYLVALKLTDAAPGERLGDALLGTKHSKPRQNTLRQV